MSRPAITVFLLVMAGLLASCQRSANGATATAPTHPSVTAASAPAATTATTDDIATTTAPSTDDAASPDPAGPELDVGATLTGDGGARSVRRDDVNEDDDEDGASTYTLVAHAIGDEVVAHGGPASATIVATFTNPTRHGGPLVFQSLTEPGSPLVDSGWIPVLLPMRPNGTIGWIRTTDVELTRNPYRIEVDVDDFTLTVFRENTVHYRTAVGIGVGDTPTPYGSFYLAELLQPSDPTGIYGPYAYGLSAFSEALDSFNGGPGVIGIHGTNQPAAIGSRVSNGCIRVANEAITELSTFLPLGTPVVIDDDPSSIVG